MEFFSPTLLLYTLWQCCDGLLWIVCIYHIQKGMLDSKRDHIQLINCLICKSDIPNRCTKEQEEKSRIPSLSCKYGGKFRRFLGQPFLQMASRGSRAAPAAPGHCTGFTFSKHTTLALKPFGAGLLGCDCRGQSSYYLIQGLLWRRPSTVFNCYIASGICWLLNYIAKLTAAGYITEIDCSYLLLLLYAIEREIFTVILQVHQLSDISHHILLFNWNMQLA